MLAVLSNVSGVTEKIGYILNLVVIRTFFKAAKRISQYLLCVECTDIYLFKKCSEMPFFKILLLLYGSNDPKRTN